MGDMLSQEEINALLGSVNVSDSQSDDQKNTIEESNTVILTDEEKDILGEIGNITMGTSATTLYALLGEKVLITTPQVSVLKWTEIANAYSRPCVGVRVDYTEGIEGSNLIILKQQDCKIITNLMMGSEGLHDIDRELSELDLSAIAEAMNQMVGSSSTSLSSLVKIRIDIGTPHAFELDFNDDNFLDNVSFAGEDIICTKFRMVIGDLIDSEIMQILPMKFAFDMVDILKDELRVPKVTEAPVKPKEEPMAAPPVQPQAQTFTAPPVEEPIPVAPPVQGYAQDYSNQPQYSPPPTQLQQNINVQPAQFQSFDVSSVMQQKENIDIIMDVPLEITVELGRTSKKIKDILEFSPGTIIELDKLAGEPIDILVNGKFIAKGEVVVIDENFGIRVTDIISREQRI